MGSKEGQYPKSDHGDKESQCRKEGEYRPETAVGAVLAVVEAVDEEVVEGRFVEETFPAPFGLLQDAVNRCIGRVSNGYELLRQPRDGVFANHHNRGIIVCQPLLMVIAHHTDNLHGGVFAGLDRHPLSESLFGGAKSQGTDGTLVNHHAVLVARKGIAEAAACDNLHAVGLQKMAVHHQHFVQPVLLGGVTGQVVR